MSLGQTNGNCFGSLILKTHQPLAHDARCLTLYIQKTKRVKLLLTVFLGTTAKELYKNRNNLSLLVELN